MADRSPEPGWSTPATVTKVIDGDTIEVEVKRRFRIRLRDCWAPEIRTRDAAEKKRGLKAKAAMIGMSMGKAVTVFIPTSVRGAMQDIITMGRFLGDVYLGDIDLAAYMRRRKLATKSKRKKKK